MSTTIVTSVACTHVFSAQELICPHFTIWIFTVRIPGLQYRDTEWSYTMTLPHNCGCSATSTVSHILSHSRVHLQCWIHSVSASATVVCNCLGATARDDSSANHTSESSTGLTQARLEPSSVYVSRHRRCEYGSIKAPRKRKPEVALQALPCVV